MQAISSTLSLPLHGVAATRLLEQQAAAGLAPHTLMQRAGLASARLSLALAPHAQHIWVACGPGNNGGDGLEAAMHLHQWGKNVTVTWLGAQNQAKVPADALASLVRARAAGVPFAKTPPGFDFAIDALLGIGAAPRPPHAAGQADLLGEWLALLRTTGQPVLALDIPSGLDAGTGFDLATKSIADCARTKRAGSRFTLTFLTLKPGLFTAAGRDLAGQVWWDDLGVAPVLAASPDAWLLGEDRAGSHSRAHAAHASHKGSFGDVAIVGGQSGADGTTHMSGAALLAGRAALHAGAGRVFVALLGQAAIRVDPQQPELMFRSPAALDLKTLVVVCGCGGGEAVAGVLPRLLSSATTIVLDADALNAIARDTQLQTQLQARHGRAYRTVLTPHPLEAARLMGSSVATVQADRLTAARQLAEAFGCVVVLKGSGTVIAAPGETPVINPTGNARLATAGTGDVLAGMVGALLAGGHSAFDAACSAVFQHGQLADEWPARHPGQALTASLLAQNHQADLQEEQQHQR
ncbi:NAD(P)H-hydrate dehydratase [Polaromonas sp. A23]|uniref:NAD(P)H-hydrate dehydratase n=1 Tax=Polaromonas sp. A23 TaxID=1944133 RepID=UPI0009873953|nr:NAD(P)H-hydrate dehydratase [Polaromonas sp. A23]OOG37954.1 NAD(P)H-hydrate dehydratase [Polaromonas sp. A23]